MTEAELDALDAAIDAAEANPSPPNMIALGRLMQDACDALPAHIKCDPRSGIVRAKFRSVADRLLDEGCSVEAVVIGSARAFAKVGRDMLAEERRRAIN